MTIPADYKCGFVTIAGRPNVGKSTLLNKLVGQKLSITSAKPQTTRLALKGIYNDTKLQVIFLDTPGYLKPRYEMHQRMLRQVSDSLKDADVLMFITDKGDFPTDYDRELLDIFKTMKQPKLAIVNKNDVRGKTSDAEIMEQLKPLFEEVLFVSAINSDNLDNIIPTLSKYLPYNPPMYDVDQLSDQSLRFFAQEIIRESIFNQFEQEIPYSTAVVIDKFEESQEKYIIDATIWVERDSQKPIIIGSKGLGLKKIREYAATQLTEFYQISTELHLWVKIKKNWRKNSSALNELGLR
jgi:GTPase